MPSTYIEPLDALSPVVVTTAHVDLLGANARTGASSNGSACIEGFSHQTYPVDLFEWNLQNLRKALDIFSELLVAGFGNSVMLLEGFAVNKVQAISANSTAFPARSLNRLASLLLTYYSGNTTWNKAAETYGKRIRSTMLNNTGLKVGAYVNYARGGESQEVFYGYKTWRLERLRLLKHKYDPEGRVQVQRIFQGKGCASLQSYPTFLCIIQIT
jgi:hypothetical protein